MIDSDLAPGRERVTLTLLGVFQFSFSEPLRLLSAVEHHNLTETARRARQEFESIPSYVEDMTRRTRAGKTYGAPLPLLMCWPPSLLPPYWPHAAPVMC